MAKQLTVSQLEDLAKLAYEQGDIAKMRERFAQADQLKIDQAEERGIVREAGYSGGAGAIRGAAASTDFMGSILPMMQDLSQTAGAKIVGGARDLLGMDAPTQEPVMNRPPAQTFRELAAEKTGGYSEYQSPTTVGQYAGTIGEFGGGAAAMPIGGPLRAIAGSVLPAIGSETAGQAFKGSEYENMARIFGALGVPTAQAIAAPATRRLAIGDPSEVQAYVKGSTRPQSVGILERAGIEDISAGQKIGSESLMRLEGAVGPSTPAISQLTRAVAKEAGIDTNAGALSANVISSNRNRLGDVFDKADDLSGGIPAQSEGMQAVNLVSDAEGLMAEGMKLPKTLTNVADTIGNAFIDNVPLRPETIKQMRAKLNQNIKTYSSAMDKQIERELAENLLETLDDMVVRQVSQTAPDFIPELNTARQQYRSHLTMERALTGGGSQKAAGRITPEALASATQRREGTSYVRGTGSDLGELSRASQEVLTPLPRVSEGGIRYDAGRLGLLRDVPKQMAARSMQDTIPMDLSGAIATRLLQRLPRQAGGLLSID